MWLGGAGVLAAALLACNLRFYLRLRRMRRTHPIPGVAVPVYVARGLPSPCLYGFPRPAVYLTPAAAGEPELLGHVLRHELTHRRHGDHIWAVLRAAALALHWYNPLVWLAAVLSRRDGELACDEGALQGADDRERAAYGPYSDPAGDGPAVGGRAAVLRHHYDRRNIELKGADCHDCKEAQNPGRRGRR